MGKHALNWLTILHGVVAVLAAIGFFQFWAKTRFWLPKYVHALAAVGFIVGAWVLSMAAPDAPVNKGSTTTRLLFLLVIPAMVYFFFVFYGGQHAAFSAPRRTLVPCPFCQKQIEASSHESGVPATQFAEQQCPHCGNSLPQSTV